MDDEDYVVNLIPDSPLGSDIHNDDSPEQDNPSSSTQTLYSTPTDGLVSAAYAAGLPPSSLKRNRLKSHIIWKDERPYKRAFLEWWRSTAWGLKVHRRLEADPLWASTSRTSNYWRVFIQLAQMYNGKPYLECSICGKILEHPNNKSNGSSGMRKHLRSDACRHSPQGRRQQSTLDVLLVSRVS